MSTSPWLTLIASEIGTALSRGVESSPGLARLAGRGTVAQRWPGADAESSLRPWQRGLAAALDIAPDSIASAAISMSHDRDAHWLHAEPVHFVAGLDRLTFLNLTDEARVTDAERTALFETLAPNFASGDFVLRTLDSEWFIRAAQPLRAVTSTPEAAAVNELQSVMPRGPDASVLRRVMTELQMLLHEHPVNEARARRGLPAVNAIWLWGGGSLAEIESPPGLPPAFGNSVFLQGLYRACGRSPGALPGSAEKLLPTIADLPRAVVVVPEANLDVLDSQWLTPLSQALAGRRLSRLDLVLDVWHVDVRRGDLRRFWRRALPPSQWRHPG